MSDGEEALRGDIPLHDPHAIGLQPIEGQIGLYKVGSWGWMVGIRLNLDMRHYRAQGMSSGFMKLDYLELTIPAPHGNYVGRIQGWEFWKSNGYNYYYKPAECQFLPDHVDFTTFAWLDAWGETDPWFYFGWGFRMDKLASIGYRRWTTVGYFGVNYPIEDNVRPGWEEVPGEAELLKMLKPSAPSGKWSVKASIGGFTVDPDVKTQSYITLAVSEGRMRYYSGALDFVKSGDWIVGEDDEDWTGVYWGSLYDPGELTMLSGTAKGCKFRVVGQFYTGSKPPPGYPANTWCIRTDGSQAAPSAMGVKAGDKYLIKSPFMEKVFMLVDFKEYYPPGTYPPMDLYYEFTPVL